MLSVASFFKWIKQQGRMQQQDSEEIEKHCLKVQEKMKAVPQKREWTEKDQQQFINAFDILHAKLNPLQDIQSSLIKDNDKFPHYTYDNRT